MKTFGERAAAYLNSLNPNFKIPKDVSFLNPYKSREVKLLVQSFFTRYFDDTKERIFILGINPGRLGGGTTGIAFTDPIRMETECQLKNSFFKKPELSSVFIYEMINQYGGCEKFYKKFFLSSVCPVGFTRDNKNINYYDDKDLMSSAHQYIIDNLWKQIKIGANQNLAICLGDGKNYKYFKSINDEHKFFQKIIPLSHPRFIMQYRRKKKIQYIELYLQTLDNRH